MQENDINSKTIDPVDHEEWERVLWKKQKFKDNFVGKSFFRVRTKCMKISLDQAFYGSVLVSQEICSCVGLVALFCGVSQKQIKTTSVFFATGIASCFGFLWIHIPLLFHAGNEQKKAVFSSYLDELKAALFTVVLTWFTAPVIKTLTASVATDTIHACTLGLLILHLILHPYGADVAIVNPTMSQNLGLFAAVCLASRLDADLDVFAFVIFAVGVFHLLPTFRFHCQETLGNKTFLAMCVAIFLGCFCALYWYVPSLCPFFLGVTLLVNLLAPLLFIYLQPCRKNIYGPWDEASIKEKL